MREFFEAGGYDVVAARLLFDERSLKCHGFAFVDVRGQTPLVSALRLDGTSFEGSRNFVVARAGEREQDGGEAGVAQD